RIVRPKALRSRGGIIYRVVAVGAEMANVLTGVGIDDQDSAIAIAVCYIQVISLGIEHHVGGPIQHWSAVDAAVRVVAVGSLGYAANPQLEVAVHVELQDKAVAAV